MPKPNVLVLRSPGTNCDEETAFGFEKAGADADRVHVRAILDAPKQLEKYQILCFPGGFSYGDDLGAGAVLAHQIRRPLRDGLLAFRDSGKLILGICNGFQILIRTGLIVSDTVDGLPAATLTNNASAKYEDRWVKLKKTSDKCVFLRGIESMELPVGHGEGRFVAKDETTLHKLDANGQIVLRYTNSNSEVGYPANPNGSQADAAGICDESGRVFGLMPHPDRHLFPTNHPQWTRKSHLPEHGDGFAVFQNAVQFFA
jgi:phosphoribosylformylglycinamidine synthase subunit PurQ / glutaminase